MLLRALAFVGISVPLIVGAVVMGFGIEGNYLPAVLTIAAILGVFQLVFSALSIVSTWADSLEYSLRSAADNFELSAKFKELGEVAQNPSQHLELRYAELKARDDARRSEDSTRSPSPKEFRYGHRAGLRQFSRECDVCHKVPTSMEPTICDVCGKF